MELLLHRILKQDDCTLSELLVDGKLQCYCIEDKDRGLHSGMSEEEIAKIKVYAKTAIPTGRYEIAITYSNRFKQYLPLLMGVKGFTGIRIHAGNTAEHTEGCILPGTVMDAVNKRVLNSRLAFRGLFARLRAVEKKEKIFITIK